MHILMDILMIIRKILDGVYLTVPDHNNIIVVGLLIAIKIFCGICVSGVNDNKFDKLERKVLNRRN